MKVEFGLETYFSGNHITEVVELPDNSTEADINRELNEWTFSQVGTRTEILKEEE